MSRPLALRRRARLDFLDAILWHDDQRSGLGDECETIVVCAILHTSRSPRLWKRRLKD